MSNYRQPALLGPRVRKFSKRARMNMHEFACIFFFTLNINQINYSRTYIHLFLICFLFISPTFRKYVHTIKSTELRPSPRRSRPIVGAPLHRLGGTRHRAFSERLAFYNFFRNSFYLIVYHLFLHVFHVFLEIFYQIFNFFLLFCKIVKFFIFF